MLGFTDPSQLKVWDNLYEEGEVSPTQTEEVRIYPSLNGDAGEVIPTEYTWKGWDDPNYHERKKKSYPIVKETFSDDRLSGGQ
jgi:hypothetical protein